MTGILIRETKAHDEVIISITKMELEDSCGIITSSKD